MIGLGEIPRHEIGRPQRRPRRLVADTGYASRAVRQRIRRQGIRTAIPHDSNSLRRFHADLKRAGLARRRLYDLRHTSATLLLADGVPVKDVSARLGHASVQITLDIYATALKTTGQRAAAKLGELLGS